MRVHARCRRTSNLPSSQLGPAPGRQNPPNANGHGWPRVACRKEVIELEGGSSGSRWPSSLLIDRGRAQSHGDIAYERAQRQVAQHMGPLVGAMDRPALIGAIVDFLGSDHPPRWPPLSLACADLVLRRAICYVSAIARDGTRDSRVDAAPGRLRSVPRESARQSHVNLPLRELTAINRVPQGDVDQPTIKYQDAEQHGPSRDAGNGSVL